MATNGLDLGSEHERAVDVRIEQRLNSEAIAEQEKLLLARVPEGDGEHAVELVRESGAVFFIGVDDRFRVASSLKAVAFLLEFSPELEVVVNLAGEDLVDRVVFVGDRLV